MSGTFPSTQGFRGLNFNNNQPNLVSVTTSGRRQAKSQGAQFFSFTVQTPPMSSAEHKEVMGFLAAQRGQFDAFQIVLPNISTPAGSVTGNPLNVNTSSADAGDKSVAVDGGVNRQTGYLKKGDVIRFTTKSGVPTQLGTKVYVLTADADTNGSGQTTLNFEPGLIEDIADDTDVETNDVQFTVFKVSPASEFDLGLSGKVQVEFEVREAF